MHVYYYIINETDMKIDLNEILGFSSNKIEFFKLMNKSPTEMWWLTHRKGVLSLTISLIFT